MINNTTNRPVEKIKSTTHMIFEPTSGWMYSHHASLAFFKDKFWAVWSNGRANEDDCGQRVMLAESDDGENWTNVRPIVTPDMIGDPRKVLIASGIYVNDNRMNVYFCSYGYAEEVLKGGNTRPFADVLRKDMETGVVSTTDGVHWSEPQFLGIKIHPTHGPQKLNSGRLLMTGSFVHPYTDNADGINGYKNAGIYGDTFGDTTPCEELLWDMPKQRGWDVKLLCEGSFYQTDDDVVHMMLRSNTPNLWHSESHDDGETWSEPAPTEYSDDASKFHFGRLPDGRFYGVSNTIPQDSRRNPLVICVSEDGVNFDKHFILRNEPYVMKADGMYKGGDYAYPHTLIHDGYMYVIYTKGKECVEVTKFALDRL